jgi:formate-dependent nitrite reductase membrane component NrfD
LSSTPEGPTYYDLPVLKEPVWIWAVPAYFYLGGAAGAAASLGAAAQGVPQLRGLVRRCRRIAFAGSAVGAGLLIHDLGRPERFLNMLRVFRPTSAMSVGSWLLASFNGLSGTAVVLDGNGPGDLAGLLAGIAGAPLSGYTGVLLSDTAVPLWQAARTTLPVLFVASGVSAAASMLELGELSEPEQKAVWRFGVAGQIAELGAMTALERDVDRVERVGLPLKEGLGGSLWRAAKVLTGLSLALTLLQRSSKRRRLAGLLGSAGAIALRFSLFHAGKASARDPRATFDQQRAGLGGAEVTGRPAVTS